MPLLFPNLRISQVFGGKTLLTTALLRATSFLYTESDPAASGPSKRVFYLKPVSTGPDNESDVSYVERNSGQHAASIEAKNLYQYREPMSPHLAARLAPDLPFPKSNDELVKGVEAYARDCLRHLDGSKGAMYVETAGGVHSPALHPPYTQCSSLLPLRLPSILIGSHHLGGISDTITSYESLLIRGYTVNAVLLLNHDYYRNHDFLVKYFADQGIRLWTIPTPPERHGTLAEDRERLDNWYQAVESQDGREVAELLERQHDERIEKLQGMPERTLKSVWWPFTQHGLVNKPEDVMVIDSAQGDHFDAFYKMALVTPVSYSSASPATSPSSALGQREASTEESLLKPYFDGSASWFTQSHGHASTPLTLAAAAAAGRYGHVLFPSGTHAPALDLAEKLKDTVGKGWADRVFYSDNGSTGTEVALKMALRAAGRRYGWEGDEGGEVGVIGLKGGYHGDTIGSMDASEQSTYNRAVDWYKGRGHWFTPPMVQFVNGKPSITIPDPENWPSLPSPDPSTPTTAGWSTTFANLQDIYDLESRTTSDLADYYRSYIRTTLEKQVAEGKRFGAVMMEPTCLGAGGMIFVDPLFQACMVEVVRASEDLFSSRDISQSGYECRLKDLPKRSPSDWTGLPIIYDEVFSGLHRFGYHSASTVLSHTPDISVYAKILTGGLLPLAATLASKSIFEAFLSDKKVDALLHGHSYTAHPIGCSVALKSIQMVDDHQTQGGWMEEKARWGVTQHGQEGRWSFWDEQWVKDISTQPGVKGAMAMGTVLAVELEDEAGSGGYSSHRALSFLTGLRSRKLRSDDEGHSRDTQDDEVSTFQIHSRPLGNVVYIMTSLFTRSEVVRAMENAIMLELREALRAGA